MADADSRSGLRVIRSERQDPQTNAEALVESIPTPTLNPADALQDMRLEESLRRMLTEKLEPFGFSLKPAAAENRYGGGEHAYTLAKGPGLELALLQVPRWIVGNDNNIGTLLPLGSAFATSSVRIISQKQDAPAFGLKRVLKDWQDHYQVEAGFVAWSYIKDLNAGKFGAGEILELELETPEPDEGPEEEGPPEEQPAADPDEKDLTIEIFLASSEELRDDRDHFDLYFRQQNDRVREQGVYLKIVRWENFLDALSETRLQDKYNEAVGSSDVFVSLFMTKTGKFTEEEFDVAHRSFKESGRPVIYTFFKKAQLSTTDADREALQSLWKFQDKLRGLGHFYTQYDNVEHLKRQFRDQLDKLLEKWRQE